MKRFELSGFFGYWGIHQTVEVRANTFKEATKGLKKKLMKSFKPQGKGANQKTFHCTVTGYRVIEEIKPYIRFKTARKLK